jgi:hypothetical protein
MTFSCNGRIIIEESLVHFDRPKRDPYRETTTTSIKIDGNADVDLDDFCYAVKRDIKML